MNLYTERQAIKEYIEYLQRNIERMNEEYKNSIQRLAELDQMEGVYGASREESAATTATNDLNFDLDAPAGVETTYPSKRTIEIEAAKDKEDYTKRRGSRQDIQSITKGLVYVLKAKGRPLKKEELFDLYEKEFETKVKSKGNVLRMARDYDPRIEQASWGYYQYR